MSRPWDIWWDFRYDDDAITHIIAQTDHPSYKQIDNIGIWEIGECFDSKGNIDEWLDAYLMPLFADLKSGRTSFRAYMKDNSIKNFMINNNRKDNVNIR